MISQAPPNRKLITKTGTQSLEPPTPVAAMLRNGGCHSEYPGHISKFGHAPIANLCFVAPSSMCTGALFRSSEVSRS